MSSIPEKVYFRFDQVRKPQKKLIQDIAQVLHSGQNLVAHASVGLGKTDAALSPAISYALQNNKKVLFLTPKISQHEIALQVCEDLSLKFDLNLKAVDLVGRKYMCIHPLIKTAEQGFYELCKKVREKEQCEMYGNSTGYSKNQILQAREHLTQIKKRFSSTARHLDIKHKAKNFRVGEELKPLCPYEVALDLGKKAQVLVADYYHIFNPEIQRVLLARLNVKLEDCILIVDEAHNLPDRIRKLLSQSLSTSLLDRGILELEKLNHSLLIQDLRKLIICLESLSAKKIISPANESLITPIEFSEFISGELDLKLLAEELRMQSIEYMETVNQGYSSLLTIAQFLEKWFTDEPSVIRVLKKHPNRSTSLQVRALDPRTISENIFSKVHSTILMSGTLLPTQMYADVLGLDPENTVCQEYSGDFPKENALHLIVPNLSSRYSQRTLSQYVLFAEKIFSIAEKIPGNTAVFFPSFNFLNTVLAQFPSINRKKILVQKENMSSSEKSELLNAFRNCSQKQGALLFACANGSLSEGIDFPGYDLLGAIVVGVPLQELSLEVQCLIDYYEDKFGSGWKYAYLYPAIVRALQSAGRVIRSEKDRGVIVFLDERYTWKNYKTCLPKDISFIETLEPEKLIENFKFN
ncbi:MAG: ATP-dependent DNA helicase [Candidatus Diapherotrites archaeon]|nr:ATP-dependent DNA helicase [Candidatus Diapherotrites archaeon]